MWKLDQNANLAREVDGDQCWGQPPSEGGLPLGCPRRPCCEIRKGPHHGCRSSLGRADGALRVGSRDPNPSGTNSLGKTWGCPMSSLWVLPGKKSRRTILMLPELVMGRGSRKAIRNQALKGPRVKQTGMKPNRLWILKDRQTHQSGRGLGGPFHPWHLYQLHKWLGSHNVPASSTIYRLHQTMRSSSICWGRTKARWRRWVGKRPAFLCNATPSPLVL